ncbi:MAG: phosphoserine phosphatase SerB [Actinomycetes bacterium]|nr:MAG: phosphoserine phosphatase SerB [Actinomycetota bacterium]
MADGLKTVLVTLHGQDRPGITAAMMDLLSAQGCEIYDVGQIVIRGRLLLTVLIGVPAERSTVRDLLFFAWEMGLEVDFEVVDPTPTPLKELSVVTLIASRVGPEEFGAVASAIARGGANIERILRLSRYPVVSYELTISGGDRDAITSYLVDVAAATPLDIAIQPDTLVRRAKRLVVMDVDSTLIQEEVIDLLAREAGVEEEVAAMTRAAMAGEMDFEQALRRRVSLLAGLSEEAVQRVAESITLTPGARTLIRTLKRLGIRTAIVSAGFTRTSRLLAERLGIDYYLSNTLEIVDGKLTGNLVGEIVDAAGKARFVKELAEREGISLDQVVAIGDGANDLEMLRIAGLGIAFNAKPIVQENADTSIRVPYLDPILFLLGIRRDQVEAADARDGISDATDPVPVPGLPPA